MKIKNTIVQSKISLTQNISKSLSLDRYDNDLRILTYIDEQPAYQQITSKHANLNNLSESEEQGVGGKMPILQPDAVGGGGKRPTSHLTIRALSETAETLTTIHRSTISSPSEGDRSRQAYLFFNSNHPEPAVKLRIAVINLPR